MTYSMEASVRVGRAPAEVTLRHDDLPTPELRDGHRVAWDTYLPRLAIAVAGGDPGADPHS